MTEWLSTHTHTGTRGLCSQRAYHQEIKFGGFPCWSSGWETACQYRQHRFDPCCRKIPHDAGQLSPRASITACHPPGRGAHALQQKKPPQWEAHAPRERLAPAHCNWRQPPCSNEGLVQPKINEYMFLKRKFKFGTY